MDTARRDGAPTYWFVGAHYHRTQDQTPRFLSQGIWENGYETRHLDEVRSMRPGERIAIKSTYVRKHGLPFDSRGNPVSTMAIKAIGTITENMNDGRIVRVDWTPVDPPREWYFYTHRGTIWRVSPGDWRTDGLIRFTFEGKNQDLDSFRNAAYWRERFGTTTQDHRFDWPAFYTAIADGLRKFRSDRAPLVQEIERISQKVDALNYLDADEYADGGRGFVRDICPFTVMGAFNRGATDANRLKIAQELARFLQVAVPLPTSFEAIPILNNMKSWFFPHERQRAADHIDALWNVFDAAIELSDDDDDDDARDRFAQAFDNANGRPNIAWNLTMGLYWIRPYSFPSLERRSREYIRDVLRVQFDRNGPTRRCNSADYLGLVDALVPRFNEDAYPVHSFPDLSLAAYHYTGPGKGAGASADEAPLVAEEASADSAIPDEHPVESSPASYGIDDICNDGCFIERPELMRLRNVLETKKNLILQGAPGTGKTWLAKRLAYALIGEKNDRRVRAVQFHPNLSYEDFVRGFRPSDGKLALVDGVFMDAVRDALQDSTGKYVVVIEEINRGNPAQIFGELLTLLEESKRTPTEALILCYPDPTDGTRRPVHIPRNLYVIGTMNIADRSLALVDLALRRRFAFATLEPCLGATWRSWVVDKCGVEPTLADDIERRMTELNQRITDTLGDQYRIGHSYVTPNGRLESGNTREWFRHIAETEIEPLLREYWFDSAKTAKENYDRFIAGW
jgi:5-methylcytosine-specific restriction protein B